MKLKLEMELDNVAMFNDGAIIECLQQVGRTVEECESLSHPRTRIRDTNGNTVGWFVVE